jgi:HAE1 family hydrophobic/amphiphilic exporter-1
MHPIEAFVRYPIKVAVGVLLLLLFGVISVFSMPMQLTPEVETPTISVTTRWPGASPQEVETEIVTEQEEQLQSVEGMTKMTSEAKDSEATVTMEFLVGTDMEEALLKVNSRLAQVSEYPEDANEPVISSSSSSDRAIAWFILSAKGAPKEEIAAYRDKIKSEKPDLAKALDVVVRTESEGLADLRMRRLLEKYPEIKPLCPPDKDLDTMRRFAENQIEPRFERVKGVSNSNIRGGRDTEMRIVIDAEKVAARNLNISDIRRTLDAQNKDISAGDFWEGKSRYVVRILGQFRDEEQVKDQLLTVVDGNPVYVRDIADVKLGYAKPDGFVRRFGSSALAINCVRETGANVIDVMAGLREVNRKLNADVLEKKGLKLTQVYDETDYINSAVGLVNQNIILGGALTAAVLMLFLHFGLRSLLFTPLLIGSSVAALVISPWIFIITLILIVGAGAWYSRGALVVALAIPVSIVGTFLMLAIMGRSLNVISLAGLAFAVGMLVDNAVVVLENIYRHRELGDKPYQAAIKGTKEVWGAVVASTLTTLAVFLPVVFVQEEAGQLFLDIALAICFAVGLSLIVSITLIPTSAARLLKSKDEVDDHQQNAMVSRLSQPFSQFVSLIVNVNAWIQRGLVRKLGVVSGLIGLAFLATWFMWPKVEYLPTGNRNLVITLILPPPGYNLDKLAEMGNEVETILAPYWDIDPDDPNPDLDGYPQIGDFFYVLRDRQVFLGIRAKDPQQAANLIDLIGAKLRGKFPGTNVIAFQSSLFARGLSASRSIDVEIAGPDLEKLVEIGLAINGRIASQKDVSPYLNKAQVRPQPSLDLRNPEIQITPKYRQAAELGLSTDDLGYMVNALLDGAYASDYYIENDKIDLVLIGNEEFRGHSQDLGEMVITSPLTDRPIRLDSVADIRTRSGPEQVNHRERERAITLSVTPPPQLALEDAIQQIETKIVAPLKEDGTISESYSINMSGTADKLRNTWDALRLNVLLAVLITYLLMVALFDSWIYPFVIILSVPMGAVGGILGLAMLNQYLVFQAWTLGQTPPAPQALDVLTMLGFVILIGTVVNNAILIVHQSLNLIREEGLNSRDAVLESVRTRVRPIFMTTTTTVLGLAPLVLVPGAGSELYRGLGSVVLGGLTFSTIFTLFLVPTLFTLMLDGWNLMPESFRRDHSLEDEEPEQSMATEPATVPPRPEPRTGPNVHPIPATPSVPEHEPVAQATGSNETPPTDVPQVEIAYSDLGNGEADVARNENGHSPAPDEGHVDEEVPVPEENFLDESDGQSPNETQPEDPDADDDLILQDDREEDPVRRPR